MTQTLAYNGLTLDRAADRRGDPAWVHSVLDRPDSVVIPYWREKCLVRAAPGAAPEPVLLAASAAAAVLAAAETPVFLGLDGEVGVFAADLSGLGQDAAAALAGASGAMDVRRLFASLGASQAATLALARGLLRWNREQRFCGACGRRAESQGGGTVRRCTGDGCGRLLFPRIEPAVIVLVEAAGPPPVCLLARPAGAAEHAYATLAGFVEIGECLEDAVRREVAEESGVQVGQVSYQASQAWPFPAGLMVGFRGTAVTDAITVDHAEVEEARWFTRGELAGHLSRCPPDRGDSIESFLIGTWLDEEASVR